MSLSGQRQAASHNVETFDRWQFAMLPALAGAGCAVFVAASFALWISLGFWTCCMGAWLLVEAAFYVMQCWRYDAESPWHVHPTEKLP